MSSSATSNNNKKNHFEKEDNDNNDMNNLETKMNDLNILQETILNNNNKKLNNRLVFGKDDALFGYIEKQQQQKPFGSVLDAGTGLHSIRWICTLFGEKGMTDFMAITADENMQNNCQRELDALGVPKNIGQVILGNWLPDDDYNDNLTNGKKVTTNNNNLIQYLNNYNKKSSNPQQQPKQKYFDVILVDYLIGAIDGFTPYKQDLILPLLIQYLNPNGGRMYIVGLQPIPNDINNKLHTKEQQIIIKTRQIRDACILLAGHKCYREYPIEWIIRQINKISNIRLIHTKQFPILYRHTSIVKQINVGRSKLQYMPTKELQKSMSDILDDLETQSLQATSNSPSGRIQLGFDYVVTVERNDNNNNQQNGSKYNNNSDEEYNV